MFRNSMKPAALPLLILISIAALSACGGASEPEDRQIDLQITEGKLNLESDVIQVSQGDTVTFNISSDEHGNFHLHGYNIETRVGPDETTVMEFVADATGRFNITFHPGGESEHSEHGGHGEMFESETLRSGDSFAYMIMQEMNGQTIPFHNHMNHEMTGSIMVSDSASLSGAVEIEIREDGSFFPAEVMVQPGTELVWNNTSSEPQRVASGDPPSANGEEEHEDEENELPLGSLEVRPR